MKTVAMFLLMEDYDNDKYESISKIIARADLQGNLQRKTIFKISTSQSVQCCYITL